jgi:PAS domain S-box-containing protein
VTHDGGHGRGDDATRSTLEPDSDLERLLQALPCGALVTSRDGTIVRANSKLAAHFGYSLEELIGSSIEALVPMGSRGDHARHRASFRKEGAGRRMGGRIVVGLRKDGTEQPFEIGLSPVRIHDQDLVVATLIDVSDRMERERLERAQEVLRERARLLVEREQELEMLARNADGLVVVGADRKVLWCNEAAAEVLGSEAGRPGGTFPVNPLAGQRVEVQLYGQPGEPRWVECAMTPMTWQGEPAVLASIRDISERRRLEHERYASRSAWILGKLAGTVAHDFNNVLMSMQGSLDMAAATEDRAELIRHLEEIRGSAERAALFTRRLLSLGGSAVPGARVLDAGRVLRELEPVLVRPAADRVAVDVQVPDEPLQVRLEPGELEQIALTLVTNALDAVGDQGHVWLKAARCSAGEAFECCAPEAPEAPVGDWILIEVGDDGEGITPEVMEHIFEPFFSTKEGPSSPGLGLTSTRAVVQRVGGHVCVHSRPGEGSVFRILLPVAEGIPQQDRLSNGSLGRLLSGDARRVLVVDDEAVIRQVVARHLRLLGFVVRTAADGRDGMEVARDWGLPIDLLLTDVVMPHADGVELARALRRDQPDLRVLFISGYSSDTLRRHEVDPDEVELVNKPFGLSTLTEAISNILTEAEQDELAAALEG